MNLSVLVREAFAARKFAYAPYSDFLVGAALLGENGKIYHGCNIENAAFSPSNCAERTAVFTAISQGERSFTAIAVVGGKRDATEFEFCFPCGVCRQVLSEFCAPDFKILVARSEEDYQTYTLSDILPFGFTKSHLT